MPGIVWEFHSRVLWHNPGCSLLFQVPGELSLSLLWKPLGTLSHPQGSCRFSSILTLQRHPGSLTLMGVCTHTHTPLPDHCTQSVRQRSPQMQKKTQAHPPLSTRGHLSWGIGQSPTLSTLPLWSVCTMTSSSPCGPKDSQQPTEVQAISEPVSFSGACVKLLDPLLHSCAGFWVGWPLSSTGERGSKGGQADMETSKGKESVLEDGE